MGNVDTAITSKTFVVGIPYASVGCGHVFSPISFVDKLNEDSVGLVKEYSIRTIQNGSLSNVTSFPYRIPFRVLVSGQVVTQSGVGVEDVRVSYCHIDPLTGVNDLNTIYCPLLVLVSDKRGSFSGEVRVSDPDWNNLIEYFNVTAALTETFSDNTTVVHKFSPAALITPLGHRLGTSSISITDNTSVSVTGFVLFDPAKTDGFNCPFSGVTVLLVHSNGVVDSTVSKSDGSFAFTVTKGDSVVVYIPETGRNYVWSSAVFNATVTLQSSSQRRLSTATDINTGSSGISRELKAKGKSKPPTFAPTSRPSATPTSSPSGQPSGLPSSTPSGQPTGQPSTIPTGMPTPAPTNRPTTSSPSSIPTLEKTDYKLAVMRHRFTFNDAVPDGAVLPVDHKVRDTIMPNVTATLVHVTSLTNGHAVLSWGGPGKLVPYIDLGPGFIGPADIITVEMWVSFAADNPTDGTLFSFGSGPSSISFPADFEGTEEIYLAVVYNPVDMFRKVYLNGELVEDIHLADDPLLNSLGPFEPANFIGRNWRNDTNGLRCSIDEFRLWSGELEASAVEANFLIGVDPSHVPLSKSSTQTNVQVYFYATSTQQYEVDFLGGLSAQARMFGADSKFAFNASDPQCGYSKTLSIDPASSSIVVELVAMNYTVTLLQSPSTPNISGDPLKPCAQSLNPYTMLASAGQLQQELGVYAVSLDAVSTVFTYRSGVCFEALGTEHFARGVQSEPSEFQACFATGDVYLNKGDSWPVTVKLFELYPTSSAWLGSSSPVVDLLVDRDVPLGSVSVLDLVSGYRSEQEFEYDDTFTTSAISPLPQPPAGLVYTIVAGSPETIAPFYKTFDVQVTRSGPGSLSRVTLRTVVPVLGTLPNDVPNVYPIASDPTLIFMIIRDPPGGNSKTTLHAGTEYKMAISIEGIRTFEESSTTEFDGGIGVKGDVKEEVAPGGVGEAHTIAAYKDVVISGFTYTGPQVESARKSSTEYEYTVSFEYDISTSEDPFIAGHPSDVIVGGGIDLFVKEATEGTQ